MDLVLPAIAIVSFFNIALGIIVFSRNTRSVVHASFLGLCVSFVAWGIAIALLFTTADVRYARMTFIGGIGIGYFLLIFSARFPQSLWLPRWLALVLLYAWLPFMGIAATDLIIAQFKPVQILGPFFHVYAMFLGVCILWGFTNLFVQLVRARRQSDLVQRQIRVVFIGFFTTIALAFTTNLILPILQGEPRYVQFGPIFPAIFIAASSVAILRYHLFRIQVLATELLVVLLAAVTFIDIFSSANVREVLWHSSLFVGVAIAGALLVRSVTKEVQRREELARLSEQLAAANTQLRSLDQLKTEFLSLATHQMRTPMSVIKGYTALLVDGAYGACAGGAQKVIRAISTANDRLITLIDEFLNISRIEQGRIRYEYKTVNCTEVLTNVVEELRPKAVEKHITVEAASPDTVLPTIEADPDKVRHLMYNLIDNAIRYTPSGGRVSVALEAQDRGISCTVRDTGVGFAAEDGARLFEKFYRGMNVRTTQVDGTGLGLFMAKRFAEHHGGRVWGKSEGIGKGSEFGFWLPLRAAKTPTQEVAPDPASAS